MLGTSTKQLRKAGLRLDIPVHTCVRLSGRLEQRESHQMDFFFKFYILDFYKRMSTLVFLGTIGPKII